MLTEATCAETRRVRPCAAAFTSSGEPARRAAPHSTLRGAGQDCFGRRSSVVGRRSSVVGGGV